MSASFTWTCQDAAGADMPQVPTGAFPTRGDAEAWLSQEWESLVEAGAHQVSLREGDTLVYGPMSLAPAD